MIRTKIGWKIMTRALEILFPNDSAKKKKKESNTIIILIWISFEPLKLLKHSPTPTTSISDSIFILGRSNPIYIVTLVLHES